MDISEINKKYAELQMKLKSLGKTALAFSGGVDSSFLLKASADTLGNNNVLACIGISESLSEHQLKQARNICKLLKVELVEIPLNELANPDYNANNPDRCYHCKTSQFSIIKEYAQTRGFSHVLCGSNYDDIDDYRPGSIAVKEQGILTPLLDTKLTKDDIRKLSRVLELPTADLPASPCLASRIAYGERITAKILEMIEKAEEAIRSMGFSEFRVRYHGQIARIEIRVEDFPLLLNEKTREAIISRLTNLGFKYVTLDLKGFRTGSLNEILTTEQKVL